MKKLLVICGPTATGKTNLAVKLAKKFSGEIISADSRQVYKFMDIGTGKDLPLNSKLQTSNNKLNFYEIDNVRLYGYDLVSPNEEFSVSHYVNFATKAISEIYSRKSLPILVGGTGLYIKAITDGLDGISVPRDLKLREELSSKKVVELFEILKKRDPKVALSLNESDRKNSRRLVRKIEVAYNTKRTNYKNKLKFDTVLKIGLALSKEELSRRIEKRVEERVNNNFEKEIAFLKRRKLFDFVPSKTLGYREWPNIEKWKLEEKKYAKRQMTWFKKEKAINWFDVSDPNYFKKVEFLVQKWHNKEIGAYD